MMQHNGQIKRREFLNRSVIALAGLSGLGPWSKTLGDLGYDRLLPVLPNGRGHEMLVLGTKTLFFYHLPMFSFKGFSSPHRYQVILEASLDKFQDVYAEARVKDQKELKKVLYTFHPEEFILSDLNRRTAPLTKLTGTIFRAPVDSYGEAIVKDVKVDVKKIYFQELNSRTIKPPQLQYIIFGRRPEIFMVHIITRPPDFDQVLSLKELNEFFKDDELTHGLKFFVDQKNNISQRVKPKSPVNGQIEVFRGDKRPIRTRIFTSKISVDTEEYLEEGELRAPPEFATTPAEKAAGFP